MTFDLHYLGNLQKPNEEKCLVSSKAGYLFMNRAAVDEEDQCEILKIFELEKTSREMMDDEHDEYDDFDIRDPRDTTFPRMSFLIQKFSKFHIDRLRQQRLDS